MQYRRIRSDREGDHAPAALLGLGLGLAAGFLLGELYAGEGKRAVRRAFRWQRAPTPANPSDLTDVLRGRLEKLLGTDAQSLDFVPVGRNALELHGWVTSRPSRVRAVRAAREALDPAIKLIDRLLVWGEDDVPAAPIADSEETDHE